MDQNISIPVDTKQTYPEKGQSVPAPSPLMGTELVSSNKMISSSPQVWKELQLQAGLPQEGGSAPYGAKEVMGRAEPLPSVPGL